MSSNDSSDLLGPILELLVENSTQFPIEDEQGPDSEGPSSTEQFLVDSRFWIQRVMVPIVVIVGVLGNTASAIVLTRRRMRSSTNVYLTALAASDLLYLLFLFSLSLAHYNLAGQMADLYWTYWRFGLWMTDATSSTSIWLTVSFTVERYIAVCHPMRGQVLCTESRARRVILLVYALCFLSTMSTPFEWQTVLKPVIPELMPIEEAANIAGENTTTLLLATMAENLTTTPAVVEWRVRVEPTYLAKLTLYRTAFYWFSSVVFVFLPLLLLCVFNTFLIIAVHRSQKQRRKMTMTERMVERKTQQTAAQENKITVTLIAVVVLFLICQSPTAVTLIYDSLSEEADPGSDRDNILRILGNLFNLLVAVNAACNFILYCALSDKYRRTFAMTFLPRRCWARRDLLRSNTLMGNTHYHDDSPSRFSRSPSVRKTSAGSSATADTETSYLQVPLNGRPILKRHQSAYGARELQNRQKINNASSSSSNNSTNNHLSTTSNSRPFNRTKSLMFARTEGVVGASGGHKSARESDNLLSEESNAGTCKSKTKRRWGRGGASSSSHKSLSSTKLLCFRLPSGASTTSGRVKNGKQHLQQEVKITVSHDGDTDEIASGEENAQLSSV